MRTASGSGAARAPLRRLSRHGDRICGGAPPPTVAALGDERARLLLLRALLSRPACMSVRPLVNLRAVPGDDIDDPFVETAVWARATLLVSGDGHLLALGQVRNPRLRAPLSIEEPAAALRLLATRRRAKPA